MASWRMPAAELAAHDMLLMGMDEADSVKEEKGSTHTGLEDDFTRDDDAPRKQVRDL